MNEKNTWEFLRDVVLPVKGNYSRIESPDTAPGFPDVHYTYAGCTGTLELKYARHVDPPFPNYETGLHRSQLKWIREETEAGGTVWIIAELPPRTTGDLGVILCIDGFYASMFNGASIDALMEMSTASLYRHDTIEAAATMEALLNAR